MLIGYARISKADGSQSLDLQRDALNAAGVEENAIYEDQASGKRDDRPALVACLKALRSGDLLVVWKLDRLGRNLHHLVNSAYACWLVKGRKSIPRPPRVDSSSVSSQPSPSSNAS